LEIIGRPGSAALIVLDLAAPCLTWASWSRQSAEWKMVLDPLRIEAERRYDALKGFASL
jgi:hypothetical protein